RRLRLAEAAGRQIVEVVRQGLTPSRILTERAFENALRVFMAVGGSTNAVVHLIAIAGRLGLKLPLDKFDAFSRTTPLLVNLRPSGQYHMEDLFEAGGVPAVLKELAPLLHLDCLTVTGQTLGENLAKARVQRRDVIRPRGGPGMPEWGSIAMPRKLLEAGVRDMVRISDARMSGTAAGTVVLHVCPEAAVGGPLALVRDGDLIELDAAGRRLNVLLSEEE